jgi:hypothetical protein
MEEQELKSLLQSCVDYHGHSCRGQIFHDLPDPEGPTCVACGRGGYYEEIDR